MSKRVNIGGTYMEQRERNTSAGAKGSFIGKWSPPNSGTAQGKWASQSTKTAIRSYGQTLNWLGGGDRKNK